MGNITNKAQKYLLNNKCADLLLNDNRTTRIEDRIYVSDIMMMFLRSEREQKDSEQQSNCNLPHVSVSLLSDLPENKPLYKDSGLWQLRTDDMDDVIIQQHSDESDEDFLEKCREIQREKERNER